MKEFKKTIDGHEMMIDAQGRYVPVENIRTVDVLRDEAIRSFFDDIIKAGEEIAALKKKVFKTVDDFLDLSASQYGVVQKASRGNITLRTYNGEYVVKLTSQEYLEFDEQLQVAKDLIDECLLKWCEGANASLAAFVKDAFRVDRKGRLDSRRILELRKYDIDDDRWKEAMDAISNSVRVAGSRRYVRFYRINDEGKEVPVFVNWNEL